MGAVAGSGLCMERNLAEARAKPSTSSSHYRDHWHVGRIRALPRSAAFMPLQPTTYIPVSNDRGCLDRSVIEAA